ncbi:hypothetical protein PFICI_03421 [Pestalotiopsis fici W106-1]|uniref:Zn(2)-C6 fungal-type domain-containing protein n=1 Tax=Pestalotiopsis fici (strain W106-1 / CGMCC3.15140) TaxID=1229662 RepID=W3XJJ5_PESFW|nr:uncharacterized protein PFICI_03421 [Pestalotiopsis fici W106-1]ETS85396.1 hypothetical protein PFICI_03421 [Pestalotiopsis fici W106-1]
MAEHSMAAATAAAEVSSSPVRALRDSFGDTRPPDISRKITACVSCRKQKIKCHMSASGPPCSRCQKRGLSCTVNRSLQMLLENDTLWKDSMEKKFQTLQDAVEKITAHIHLPRTSSPHQTASQQESRGHDLQEASTHRSVQHSPGQQGNSWDIILDPHRGVGDAPGSCIGPSTNIPQFTHQQNLDIVTKGVVEAGNAEIYFNKYRNRLDHFVYSLLGDQGNESFDALGHRCPLLAAAVCTVGALHSGSRNTDYESCRKELIGLSENMSLI